MSGPYEDKPTVEPDEPKSSTWLPFSQNRVCWKCCSTIPLETKDAVRLQYCQPRFLGGSIGWVGKAWFVDTTQCEEREHIHKACARCGFEWIEGVAP